MPWWVIIIIELKRETLTFHFAWILINWSINSPENWDDYVLSGSNVICCSASVIIIIIF